MEDHEIIALYEARNTDAIEKTREKYGKLCYRVAYHLLHSREDAEECENDAYLDAWHAIPPQKPDPVSAFMAMLSRRRALDRYRKRTAEKRQYVCLSLAELDECIPDGRAFDETLSEKTLVDILNRFLKELDEEECDIFLRRYWYMDNIKAIALRYGYGLSRVKMILKRTREKLLKTLEREGIFI